MIGPLGMESVRVSAAVNSPHLGRAGQGDLSDKTSNLDELTRAGGGSSAPLEARSLSPSTCVACGVGKEPRREGVTVLLSLEPLCFIFHPQLVLPHPESSCKNKHKTQGYDDG